MSTQTTSKLGLYVVVVMVAFDASALYTVIPSIHAEYALATMTWIGWSIRIYSLLLGACLMAGGVAASRYSSFSAFRSGTALFGTASLGCIMARSINGLIIARAAQGVGGALVLPSSLALLLECGASADRPRIISVWTAFGGVAAGVAPVVAGALTQLSSWHAVFAVNLPLCLLAVLTVRRSDPESWKGRPPVRQLPVGTLLLGVVAAIIVVSLDSGWGTMKMGWRAAWLGAAVGILVWCVKLIRQEPVNEYLADLSALLTQCATVLFGVCFGVIFFSFPIMLDLGWHYGAVMVGILSSIMTLLSIPFVVLTAKAARRYGSGEVLLAGALSLTGGGVVSTIAFTYHNLLLGGVAILLNACGIGLCYPTLGAIALAYGCTATAAVGSSLTQCCRHVGTAVGVGMAAIVFTGYRQAPPARMFVLLAGTAICLCITVLLLVQRMPKAATYRVNSA